MYKNDYEFINVLAIGLTNISSLNVFINYTSDKFYKNFNNFYVKDLSNLSSIDTYISERMEYDSVYERNKNINKLLSYKVSKSLNSNIHNIRNFFLLNIYNDYSLHEMDERSLCKKIFPIMKSLFDTYNINCKYIYSFKNFFNDSITDVDRSDLFNINSIKMMMSAFCVQYN